MKLFLFAKDISRGQLCNHLRGYKISCWPSDYDTSLRPTHGSIDKCFRMASPPATLLYDLFI